jgi:hypothetical protein
MLIKIKKLEGKRWQEVGIDELQGNSVFTYMGNEEQKITAAVYEEDNVVMVISNDSDTVKHYKDNGKLSFKSSELQELLSAQLTESYFVSACTKIFGNCKYISLETLDKEDACTQTNKQNRYVNSQVLPVTSAQQQELL